MVEALTGIQVVEMAAALQGPAAAGYLRDMGAEVTRVESPEGDGARYHRGAYNYTPQGTLGAQFVHSNKGKRTISIDVNSEQGREIVYKLVAGADVFLTNRLESSLERMGYGYDTLRAIKPDLIYAAVNGFGHLGPQADKRMVDGAGLARGGLIHVTGPRDGPPVLPGAVIADMAGAMQLALGVMTALFARERHGVAQKVNTSSYGAQIWLQAWEIQQAAMTGNPLMRDGAHHANLPGMYGVYTTSDGEALFLAFPRTDESWRSFCNFGGMPEIGVDHRWNAATKRMGMAFDAEGTVASQIRPYMERAFASKTMARVGRVPRFRAPDHLQPRLQPSGRARRPAGHRQRLHPGDRRRHAGADEGSRSHRRAERDAGLHQGPAAAAEPAHGGGSLGARATTGTRSSPSTSRRGKRCAGTYTDLGEETPD